MRIKGPVEKLIYESLQEDIGGGDVTTETLIPKSYRADAEIYAKAEGVLAGIEIPREIFAFFDKDITYREKVKDGSLISPGQVLAEIKGSARAILTGERTSLNFIQHLSGIATVTHSITSKLKGSKIQLLDTRKTIPGMRYLEKYAVFMGGGKNHRKGLYDGILIKNNHLKFSSIKDSILLVKREGPAGLKIEVEVENLEQVDEAISAGADIIMLDNMDIPLMKKAIEKINARAKIEVSGNITEDNIPELIKLNIDYVSMGRLTHSAKALDISLRITHIEKK